jgi:hypothetical protein
MDSHKLDRARRLFAGCDQKLLDRFLKFHQANPIYYRMFSTFAHEAVKAGLEQVSPWMLVHRMRWHCVVETTGQAFAMSNAFIGLYARLLAIRSPAFEFYFDLRPLKGGRRREASAK